MEKLNEILLNDLKKYFRRKRNLAFQSLFMGVPKKKEPTNYEYYTDAMFDVFNSFLMNQLTTNSDGYARILTRIPHTYFKHDYNFNNFIIDLMNDKGHKMRLHKMSLTYDKFLLCRRMYSPDGYTDFEVNSPPRYTRLLRLTFCRFKANPKCIIHTEEAKEIEITISMPDKYIEKD